MDKTTQNILELISTLPDEDREKVFLFLYGIFYGNDPHITYYGKDGILWKSTVI